MANILRVDLWDLECNLPTHALRVDLWDLECNIPVHTLKVDMFNTECHTTPEIPTFSGIKPEIMPDSDLRRKLTKEDEWIAILFAMTKKSRRF